MNNQKGIWSNCAFLVNTIYTINKKIVVYKTIEIIIKTISQFVPILFLKLIIDDITLGRGPRELIEHIVLLAGITFIFDIVKYILKYHIQNHTEITIREVQNYLGTIVMRMSYEGVEQPKIRDFISLASDSKNFLGVFDNISTIITSTLSAGGLFVVVLTAHPIIIFLILGVVTLQLITDKKSRKLWGEWRPKYAPIMRKSTYLTRIMKSIEFGKEIRINNLLDWIYKKNEVSAEEYLKAAKTHNIEIQKNGIAVSIANIIQECSVYLILAYSVIFYNMTIGDFSMYVAAIKNFSSSVSNLVAAIAEIMKQGLFISDFRYCSELAKTTNVDDGYMLLDKEHENITLEFKNVSFKYPNSDDYVLKNISFTFVDKKTYSLVGMNGSGKTTLVKLICRLYKPTQGEITLNGINIWDINFDQYISLIGTVFQDFKLFAFSIEENVALSLQADIQKLDKCLSESSLGHITNQYTDGIKTQISKEFDSKGIELSGGEGQKLAMARVLYKRAPIVIFDEPTAALDPIAEAEIYSKLHEIVRSRTAIFISHRLSSCQFCDKVLVIEKGKIVQAGSHDELVSVDGLYAQMWHAQAQYYK